MVKGTHDSGCALARCGFVVLAAAIVCGTASADNCPPIPSSLLPYGEEQWDVYVERHGLSNKSQTIEVFLSQYAAAACPNISRLDLHWQSSDVNQEFPDGGKTHRLWFYCDNIRKGNVRSRPSDWPSEINFCPNNGKSGGAASGSDDESNPPKTPAKARCNKKDIEGNWQRTRDGSQIRIAAMFRKDGGQALMHKYFGSIKWPQPVSKFYSVRQIGNSCDFKARCTTIHSNRASKSYNFSAVPCTLRLSPDKKKITTSDGSGTWLRGWK